MNNYIHLIKKTWAANGGEGEEGRGEGGEGRGGRERGEMEGR